MNKKISLRQYLIDEKVTCSVREFIEFSPRGRSTIEKYFKHERQMIDAYIEEWKLTHIKQWGDK